MGKRSSFERIERDQYDTPPEAVAPLLRHLEPHTRYIEPSAGRGALVKALEAAEHECVSAWDIEPRGSGIVQRDMLSMLASDIGDAKMVIANTPWKRKLMHQAIVTFRLAGIPAWLLIDANWAFTQQAAPYLPYCSRIVVIGRVCWFPDTETTGKDDAASGSNCCRSNTPRSTAISAARRRNHHAV